MSDQSRRVIKLEQEKTTFPVSAKCCLWFTWAADGLNGVEHEDPVELYRPVEVDVENISEVTVSVDSSDQWSHHPGNLSNAGGINDVRGLENAGYRDAKYNSLKIKPLSARLNLLVGMVTTKDPPVPAAPDVDQIEIGLGKTITINDITAERLFLGFHDGRHWFNNEHAVDVTVTVNKRR
jgi:hypothetical protein